MTAAARTYRHRRLMPYAAALVALATLGACTGSEPGSAATTTPPASSSATTSSAPATTSKPTPTATVDPVLAKIPAAARAESVAGSVAFGEYFMSQVNQSFTHADSAMLTGLFTTSCKACLEFSKGADELKRDGLRHKGVSLKTTGANSNEFTPKTRSVALLVTQNSVPVINESGRTVRKTTAGTGTLLATLSYRSDHWVVTNLQVAK